MSNEERMKNIRHLIQVVEPTFNKLAEIHGAVTHQREASFAWDMIRENDYLAGVAMGDQDSFKRAIIGVASIGLSLNPNLKLAYLVPRKKKVCLDISYLGFIALAVEIGSILWAIPELVHKNDVFLMTGIGERPTHEFDPFSTDRGEILGGYCVAKLVSQEYITVFMSLKEMYAIRDLSESYKKGSFSPWKTHEEAMLKKTLVRRAYKLWPKCSTHKRFVEAVEVEAEVSPELVPPVLLPSPKRNEKFGLIEDLLLKSNHDQDHFIKEDLSKLVRRKVASFDELTDLEIDQVIIFLDMPKEKE